MQAAHYQRRMANFNKPQQLMAEVWEYYYENKTTNTDEDAYNEVRSSKVDLRCASSKRARP